MLPARRHKNSGKQDAGKRSPGHRAWVRLHACSACGSTAAIECAHVREGTGGGLGMKPADKWCLSLCHDCHARQHQMGEASFEIFAWGKRGKMRELAEEFARKSPHAPKLREME